VTDYFDSLENERRTAVPGVARRRRRPSLPRVTAGRLGLLLMAAPVAVAVLTLVLLARGSSAETRSVQGDGAAAGPAMAAGPPVRRAPLRLYGDGLGDVRFGASPGAVSRFLRPRLGKPHAGSAAGQANCGVDGEAIWPLVLDPRTGHPIRHEEPSVAFDHSRFVGYQFGGADPRLHGKRIVTVDSVTTARGLRIGDSLARGRRLYGHAFHLSNAQGGSWSVRTPRGVLRGFARVRSFPIGPSARVETIDAGDVGCPAVSP
jgi:hypothetical protein